MTRAKVREAQRLLKQIGWPIKVDGDLGPRTRQAIQDFKRGFHLFGRSRTDGIAPFHRIDGSLGPVTLKRLTWSAEHGGRCSKHFHYREFASSHSGWIRTHRDLVAGLDELRKRVGHPIAVLSGFRDFNLGAPKSQHKFGNAMDPTARLPLDDCLACKAFSGIGLQPGAGHDQEVRHLDVRHADPEHNFTGSTPAHPEIFNDTFQGGPGVPAVPDC